MVKTIFTIALLAALGLQAADITPGYTFSSGEQNVTHTKLNSSAAGTINTTFYTGKSANTTPASSVVVLVYNPSTLTYQQSTLSQLILDNALLIGSRSGATSVSGTNSTLIWDGLAYYKTDINTLVRANDQAQTNRMFGTNYVLITSGTNVYKVALGDLWTNTVANINLNSLTNKAIASDNDLLLIYDSVAGSNKNITASQMKSPVLNTTDYPIHGGVRAVGTSGTFVYMWGQEILFKNTNGNRFLGSKSAGSPVQCYITNFDTGYVSGMSNMWAYAYMTTDGTNYGSVMSTNEITPILSAPTNYYKMVAPVFFSTPTGNRLFTMDNRTYSQTDYYVVSNAVGPVAWTQITTITSAVPNIAAMAWGTMGTSSNTIIGMAIALDNQPYSQVQFNAGNRGDNLTLPGEIFKISTPYHISLAPVAFGNPAMWWTTSTNRTGFAITVSGFSF